MLITGKKLQKPVAITLGEPAGIGPDIALKLIHAHRFSRPLVLIANRMLLLERVEALKIDRDLLKKIKNAVKNIDLIEVPLPVPCKIGEPDAQNSVFVLTALEQAVQGCLNHSFSAMVTGPVNKAIIKNSGVNFLGHTEYLAEQTHSPHVVMLFMYRTLRLALVTTHIPLRAVPTHITPNALTATVLTLQRHLIETCHIARPKIIVSGLNPHAGEQGHLGDEEIRIIQPTLEALRQKNPGLKLIGPVSADTIFYQAQQHQADCILSMYHDQSLPVMKAKAFHRLVNVTLGLPFVRTSVDHGTAFELAGTGHANERSLVAAVQCAITLSQKT